MVVQYTKKIVFSRLTMKWKSITIARLPCVCFLDFKELLTKLKIGSDSHGTHDSHEGHGDEVHDHKRRKRASHEHEGEHTSVVDKVNGLPLSHLQSSGYRPWSNGYDMLGSIHPSICSPEDTCVGCNDCKVKVVGKGQISGSNSKVKVKCLVRSGKK